MTVKGCNGQPMQIPPVRRELVDPELMPIDWQELMIDLRVDSEEDEALLKRLMLGACAFIERRCGYVLVPTRYTIEVPFWWWQEPLYVLRGPYRSVESVTYMRDRDVWETVDPLSYYSMPTSDRDFGIRLLSTFTRPDLWSEVPLVRITALAGYQAFGESDFDGGMRLEDGLRQVTMALIAHYYQHRELFAAGKAEEVEMGAGNLLNAYKRFW